MSKSFEYEIRANQVGAQSRELLRPRSLQETIKVSCAPPTSQMLLWAQQFAHEDTPLVNLPNSRSLNSTRARYVLVNTSHYVRLLMLDQRQHASIDHSSLRTEIFSSNSSLAKVTTTTIDEKSSVTQYDKRKIQVFDEPGTVYIKS